MVQGAANRFGARYGRTVREKFAIIEAEHRKKFKCPYCHNFKVKRIAAGIWQCRKCEAKFSGRAYTIPKKIVLKQEVERKEPEAVEEIEMDIAEESEEVAEKGKKGGKKKTSKYPSKKTK